MVDVILSAAKDLLFLGMYRLPPKQILRCAQNDDIISLYSKSGNALAASLQNTNFTCTHMLRLPLSVKPRFRKRDGNPAWGPGEPNTLFSGI